MKKDETIRMCCVCRTRKPKSELIKVVRNKNGEFFISDGHEEGRGAYICKDSKCIETAIKKRALNRSFKCEVPKETYESINISRE